MNKIDEVILSSHLVAIIRCDNEDIAYETAKLLWKAGVQAVEITLTVPNALNIISRLVQEKHEGCFIGAGSVRSMEDCKRAIEHGAEFIISPIVDKECIELCNRINLSIYPGAMTPTEIETANKQGAHIIKVFPASILGPDYIKALKAPMPELKIMATGGINRENAKLYLSCGADILAVGSGFTKYVQEKNNLKVLEETNALLDIIHNHFTERRESNGCTCKD